MATRARNEGTVYLMHFASKIGNPLNVRAQAQHYIGWTRDLVSRETQHKAGQGAKILAACVASGIAFEVARTWQGTRKLERSLKNKKKSKRFCPICIAEWDDLPY